MNSKMENTQLFPDHDPRFTSCFRYDFNRFRAKKNLWNQLVCLKYNTYETLLGGKPLVLKRILRSSDQLCAWFKNEIIEDHLLKDYSDCKISKILAYADFLNKGNMILLDELDKFRNSNLSPTLRVLEETRIRNLISEYYMVEEKSWKLCFEVHVVWNLYKYKFQKWSEMDPETIDPISPVFLEHVENTKEKVRDDLKILGVTDFSESNSDVVCLKLDVSELNAYISLRSLNALGLNVYLRKQKTGVVMICLGNNARPIMARVHDELNFISLMD
ncbi:hypothetical protein [Carp edema virus]|nr:hypothetical protein [Carp edema virus]